MTTTLASPQTPNAAPAQTDGIVLRMRPLLDTAGHGVFVYRPGRGVETLDTPSSVSADPELPGFTLGLTLIWNPDF